MILRWIIRAAFVLLIVFEAANYYRLFHFEIVYTWIGLLVTAIAVFLLVEAGTLIMRRAWHARLPASAWALAFLAVLIDAFGDFFHLYSRFPWYDQVAHIMGSAVTAFLIFIAYRTVADAHAWRHPEHLSLIIAVCIAMTLGVFYEIEEYLEDYFNLTNRLGDGRDTANDLLMNFFGTLIAAFAILTSKYGAKKIRGSDTSSQTAEGHREI